MTLLVWWGPINDINRSNKQDKNRYSVCQKLWQQVTHRAAALSCQWHVLSAPPGDASRTPWSDLGAAGKQYQGPVPSPAASSPQRPPLEVNGLIYSSYIRLTLKTKLFMCFCYDLDSLREHQGRLLKISWLPLVHTADSFKGGQPGQTSEIEHLGFPRPISC